MFKKSIVALLASSLLLATVSCGGASTTVATTKAPDAAETTTAAGETAAATDASTPEATDALMLYYSHSTEWADPIIEEFQQTSGIKVELVQGGTSDLFAKVKAEADNPQADVIWGGVVDTYNANRDMLQPYTSKELDSLKEIAIGKDQLFYGFDIGPMVMIYNTKLVSEAEAPTKWEDLLDEKWKGKIACADPTSSSSSFATIMAIIMAYGKDDGKGYEFVENLVNNLDGKIISSSSGTFKCVSDGEYLIGMTYEEGALRYVESGADLAIVYPEEGTTVSPSGVGIINGARNLDSAQKFIDFILSKQVQTQLGGLLRRTVRKDVEDPTTMTSFDKVPLVDYDMAWVADHEQEFKEKWMSFVTQ